jgi:hypothetical protein
MVRDARLRVLLTTMRVSLASRADLPPCQIKSGPWAAANQPDGQITSDYQKWCQAPKSKIFLFPSDPNQMHIHRCLVPQEGRSRVVTSAGRDAVDAKASGAHWQSQGEMNLVSGFAGVQDDRRFSRTAKSRGSDAPGLASSFVEVLSAQPGFGKALNPRNDGGNKAWSPGRARSKP